VCVSNAILLIPYKKIQILIQWKYSINQYESNVNILNDTMKAMTKYNIKWQYYYNVNIQYILIIIINDNNV